MKSPLFSFLLRELRISERDLDHLILTAPERYRIYHIEKRGGGRREIAQPAVELKLVQRALMREFLCKLPVHPAASAYQQDSSIKKNAQIHANVNGPILKLDFKDFFPSITESAWLSYCRSSNIFDRGDAIRSGRLMFRRPKGGRILRLSVGAPSSPMLSNILLYKFDEELQKRVERHKVIYTRYADDMTFSAIRTGNLMVVESIVRSVLNQITSPKLALNGSKTVMVTKSYHRQITGIVISLDGKISLGHEKKRNLRAAVHHYMLGRLNLAESAKLAGSLAFAKDIEPEFYKRLNDRYGSELLLSIVRYARDYRRPVITTNLRRLMQTG